MYNTKIDEDYIVRNIIDPKDRYPFSVDNVTYKQLSLFDDTND